ncbi:hypothetical protein MMC28_008501 [Mycoblastus sanguinarius]|nr:hypothetical protein [Mycoblastus sanguinarius]
MLALLPVADVSAVNVVLSNDDGWAEINIRQFYDALTNSGLSVIISAPAENESGTGSSDATPTPLTEPCEYNSCPSGSPATGYNSSMPRFNYVNSYPVTSMRYGIQTLSPEFFGGAPDIAVAGFNVGANLGTTVLISGTVGAATEATKEGIPGIAFSGTTGSQTGYTSPLSLYETVYADLSTNVTNTLIASGKPYLPENMWLNVNFPAVSSSSCSSLSDFRFVLSRINTATSETANDVVTCDNGGRLPTETSVVDTDGCYASVSVGVATTKADANATEQAVVLGKLAGILSCLP